MPSGVIIKALSGFYYIRAEGGLCECRARGIMRLGGVSPLVGDRAEYTVTGKGKGVITKITERRNAFVRPAVANVDQLVIIASAVIPVTDPFLIDRVSVIALDNNCEVIICINKTDMDAGDKLSEIYTSTGFKVILTSAVTSQGISQLRSALSGKISALTGNSGVGKSSILNAIDPELKIKIGEVSEKLGRGRHTTRHVELYAVDDDTFIADTPGFASFDVDQAQHISKDRLQYCFPEFETHLGGCRFSDCSHRSEPDCAVITAVDEGVIHPVRHASYMRLYDLAAQVKDWEINQPK